MDYTKLTVSELANGISQTEAALGRCREILDDLQEPKTVGLQAVVEAASNLLPKLEADLKALTKAYNTKRKIGARWLTDLLLRRVSESRPGAEGQDDYDVIVDDGFVIGRIFKATASPAGMPWRWTLAYGQHGDRTPTHGYEATREAALRAFAKSWWRE
jgi:hypothetical protein